MDKKSEEPVKIGGNKGEVATDIYDIRYGSLDFVFV